MASVVDVVNKALDKLGYGAITSLDDGTKAANLADRTWPLVRDQALRDHPWNFAVTRTNTAPLSSTPDWDFLYWHELPSDCLRLLEIKDVRSDQYQIEKGRILTNESVLYIRYIARIEDANEYDSLFIDAVASLLAYEMCESLTQSNSKMKNLYGMYENAMLRAKKVDAMENPPATFKTDSWIEVRY